MTSFFYSFFYLFLILFQLIFPPFLFISETGRPPHIFFNVYLFRFDRNLSSVYDITTLLQMSLCSICSSNNITILSYSLSFSLCHLFSSFPSLMFSSYLILSLILSPPLHLYLLLSPSLSHIHKHSISLFLSSLFLLSPTPTPTHLLSPVDRLTIFSPPSLRSWKICMYE